MAFAASGCGGRNPGGGTKTLYVKAQAVSDGSTDNTAMGVEVREGHSEGNLVTDAVVTVVGNKTGEFNLAWTGINWGGFKAGAYYKDKMQWDTGWKITVKRGQDELDAYLVAPGITTITEPIAATTFKRAEGKPLMVKWKDSDGDRAQIVKIDFDKSDSADREFSDWDDPFELQVEPNTLVPDNERVTVSRQNQINLEGGTAGSIFTAETHHRIQFTVE